MAKFNLSCDDLHIVKNKCISMMYKILTSFQIVSYFRKKAAKIRPAVKTAVRTALLVLVKNTNQLFSSHHKKCAPLNSPPLLLKIAHVAFPPHRCRHRLRKKVENYRKDTGAPLIEDTTAHQQRSSQAKKIQKREPMKMG